MPDVLVMTATPIPRTAAMTVYGDLDVTVLDELPPGRTPIAHGLGRTGRLERGARRGRDVRARWTPATGVRGVPAHRGVREARGARRPRRRSSACRPASSPGCGSGCCTAGCRRGEGSGDAAFRDGELDVLVATTVIEVGVDVPNATVMVILDADRFGIAQLHQLRGPGRAGRATSSCCLVGDRRPARGRGPRSRRWCARPTGSSWPRSTSSSAARARSWASARRAATT